MTTFMLAWQSIGNRRTTALLSVFAIALSITLFLGVERMRIGAKSSFTNTISGTDLIVGARAGSVQLLLYSVFRIGNATSNISMDSLDAIEARDDVAWVVPISLGDSHRGYRVMGTSNDYFEHYRYRNKQPLEFSVGQRFEDLFDVVIGAEIAQQLGYQIGASVIISHGIGAIGGNKHDDMPFKVSGILRRTGTPVDRTVHVSLAALEAIHLDWENGSPSSNFRLSADQVRDLDLQPSTVTAALVGTRTRFGIFQVQRFVNEFKNEPLTAVLPGVALQELWSIVGVAETALTAVSAMVVLTAILGLVTMILSTLNERRQEIAILRSIGAHTGTIFSLLMLEAVILAAGGILLGTGLLYALLFAINPWIEQSFGLYLAIEAPSLYELKLMGLILVIACVVGTVPALRAYRQSLVDGMSVQR
jgi:putative ABC transport system permease protein